MEQGNAGSTTRMLAQAGEGKPEAMAGLTAMVYDELRALAAAYLRRERAGHSLQPTALVHEAFLKLIDSKELKANDRRHFFAIAANTMRRVLVEHARTKGAAKRGGGQRRVTLTGIKDAGPDAEAEVVALDEALKKLSALDERQARIVELRFFGGLPVEDVADLLGVSKRTVEGDWTLARAWLLRELAERAPEKPS
jgi:RNA polymerase sigma factor (TIGR02999 family)